MLTRVSTTNPTEGAEVNTTTTKPVIAEVGADGDRVEIRFAYNPKYVVAAKKVAGYRFVAKDKPGGPCWRYQLDLTTCRLLREKFGKDLQLGPKLTKWGIEEVAKEKAMTDLSQADDAKLDNVPQNLKWGGGKGRKQKKLRPYQRADIKFMASANTINANQPGAGKTSELILSMFEAELEKGQHLVFAPIASLRSVWEAEINSIYKAMKTKTTVLTGDTPKERAAAVLEAQKLAKAGKPFWLIVNPAMARLKRQKVEGTKGDEIRMEEVLAMPELAEIGWTSITIDEFHLMGLSNPATLAARGVNEIIETTQPDRTHTMSGTPMGGKPIKLWGALRTLNPGEFTSRWNWAKHWLVINNNGYGSSIEGIMPGREVDFYNHLKPYLVRRTKREALPGLPPKQTIDIWCDMTPKQAEQYKMFATEAEWRLDDAAESGRLTATNVLAEYMRLKQFASAFCSVQKTGREINDIDQLEVKPTSDSGKLIQLMEKLAEENVLAKGEDDDKPKCAIIFSQFNGMVEMIAQALAEKKIPVATITGKTSGKNRAAAAKAFQEQGPGAPRVLVMNTKAGGTAMNLSMADSVHLMDETWVPDDQEQAEDRAHRGDDLTMAKDEVRMYYYRTNGSIEEYIRQLVADKQLNNRTILDLRRRMQKDLAEAEANKASGV